MALVAVLRMKLEAIAISILVPKKVVILIMLTNMYLPLKLNGAAQCLCGSAIMLLRQAVEFARRPGKYYFICPASLKHPNRFIWDDEYHRIHSMPNIQPTFNGSVSSGAPSTNFVNRKDIHNDPPQNESSNDVESLTSTKEHRSLSPSNIPKHACPSSSKINRINNLLFQLHFIVTLCHPSSNITYYCVQVRCIF